MYKTDKRMDQRIKSDNFIGSNGEKGPILLSQRSTKIISYFGSINNIFAVCKYK